MYHVTTTSAPQYGCSVACVSPSTLACISTAAGVRAASDVAQSAVCPGGCRVGSNDAEQEVWVGNYQGNGSTGWDECTTGAAAGQLGWAPAEFSDAGGQLGPTPTPCTFPSVHC